MSTTLFISDLHLDPVRPAMVRLFLQFLKAPARECSALYILGDLFEIWIGDDNGRQQFGTIIDALQACTSSGTPVFIMHGNRDFLLGNDFFRATGCRPLADPTVVDLAGDPTLLMHGDTLCTGDQEYQDFRARVRNPQWQREFLSKTVIERSRIATELRGKSQAAVKNKLLEIMDVHPQAVEDAFRNHGVQHMIHGHTHKPAIHSLTIDDIPAQRIVLGDWYRRGSVLRCKAGKLTLQQYS